MAWTDAKSGHDSICSRFNLGRRLTGRDVYKTKRSAAQAEWRRRAA